MKLLPLSIITLIILTSVVKKSECNCAVQNTYYYKGEVVKRVQSKSGFFQTVPKGYKTLWQNKPMKFDSLAITPINEESISLIPNFIQK